MEQLVNAEIVANAATEARLLPIEEAKKTGAMMLFGEKYGDEVRVLEIGTSRELCGEHTSSAPAYRPLQGRSRIRRSRRRAPD